MALYLIAVSPLCKQTSGRKENTNLALKLVSLSLSLSFASLLLRSVVSCTH